MTFLAPILTVITDFINLLNRKFIVMHLCFLKSDYVRIKMITDILKLMRSCSNAIDIK